MPASSRILVDADACPVKAEAVKVAERHRIEAIFVANQWLQLPRSPSARMQVVSGAFDAADDWIATEAGPHDVIVTADIPLASRCLKRGAQVLSSNGKPFTDDNIGSALATRELMSDLRAYGVKGGPPAFSPKDRSRFLEALELSVRKAAERAR